MRRSGVAWAAWRVRAERAAGAGLLALGLLASPKAPMADEIQSSLEVTGRPGEPEPVEAVVPPVEVELDRLLKLPTGLTFDSESRQGVSEAQWRARFRESRARIQTAEQALAQSRAELEAMTGGAGGGQWQMAPPGSNSTENSPVSFKLREQIRRGKEQVEEAERGLRELEVQADLADVPPAWREG